MSIHEENVACVFWCVCVNVYIYTQVNVLKPTSILAVGTKNKCKLAAVEEVRQKLADPNLLGLYEVFSININVIVGLF